MQTAELDLPGQSRPLPFRVYLPPCYDQLQHERYPVLYLLHGLLGTDGQWDELGADEWADALIAQGAIPPFLMVMPWERSGIELEAALVEDLLPYIDRTYRTLPDARWRAIGGLSRGAGQALEIGLRHPDVFSQIGLHSPAVLHSQALIARWLGAIPEGSLPRIWIDIGRHDTLLPTAAGLAEFLFLEGVAPALQYNVGTHDAGYWSSNLPTYLRWHGGLWRAAQMQDAAREGVP